MKQSLELDKADINKLATQFASMIDEFDKRRVIKEILMPSAKIVQAAAKANIPVAAKPSRRYKAGGGLTAVYYPGNLRRSIKVLPLKGSKNSLSIGAKWQPFGTKGVFRGARVDGWYAHFVEFGSPQWKRHPRGFGYMRKAWGMTKRKVELLIIKKLQDKIKEFAR